MIKYNTKHYYRLYNYNKNHSENEDTSTSVTFVAQRHIQTDTKTNCSENITPPRFRGGVKKV